MENTNTKELSLEDIILAAKNVKTLDDMDTKPGQWYSVLTVIDGHIIRYAVVVRKDGIHAPDRSRRYMDKKACLDPILISKDKVNYHLYQYENMIYDLHNKSVPTSDKGIHLPRLVSMQAFRDAYVE